MLLGDLAFQAVLAVLWAVLQWPFNVLSGAAASWLSQLLTP